MPIDPSAVGSSGGPVERSWTSKDCLLYALGVGAGLDELRFTTEKNQQVLPTTVVVLGARGAVPMQKIGSFNPAMLVHGEQAIELARPLPPDGTVQTTGKIAAVYDKGKGAVVVNETKSYDESGELLAINESATFVRGAGGWGGDRGPSADVNVPPDRKPDAVIEEKTAPNQALLYRLSGDWNPLHADPGFAKAFGFERPILHGLCTFGFTGRALLHAVCGSDPSRFKHIEGRFSTPVMPGDTLDVKIWVDGNEALYQTCVGDNIVLDSGKLVFE